VGQQKSGTQRWARLQVCRNSKFHPEIHFINGGNCHQRRVKPKKSESSEKCSWRNFWIDLLWVYYVAFGHPHLHLKVKLDNWCLCKVKNFIHEWDTMANGIKFSQDLQVEFKKSFRLYHQISWRVLTKVGLNFVHFERSKVSKMNPRLCSKGHFLTNQKNWGNI